MLTWIGLLLVLIWMIRPLYNFFAKSKYVLLDHNDNSIKTKIKAGLPAFIFYLIIIGFMFVPAIVNNLTASIATGGVILLQLFIIFGLTRYDKRQTKYKVLSNGIKYRRRFIKWDEDYDIKFKKTWLILLHKPRYILKSSTTKIVIPMLSKNITSFIKALSKNNKIGGSLANTIYQNTRLYYISNIYVVKKLNKH
jgi:hypothetical protein